MKGGHGGRRTGGQEDRGRGGQEDRTGGTIHWLTCIAIDVPVLHPAVILLQLILTKISKKIFSTNCFYYFISNCAKVKKKSSSRKHKELPKKIISILNIGLVHIQTFSGANS